MKKSIIIVIGILLIFLIGSYPVAAYFIESGQDSSNGDNPTILVEYGKGKDTGLVRVTHIHYAKSDIKGKKPPTTDTCYKFAGWRWTFPVTYTIAAGDPYLSAAIENADTEWDSHTKDDLFNKPATGDFTWGVRDYYNSVSYGNYKKRGVIAVTVTWYNITDKTAVESDILFDTDFVWGDAMIDPSVMDLENIATHEIGHTLGLSDLYTTSCSDVTMYGYSTEGDIAKRDLAIPDITGLQMIYGR